MPKANLNIYRRSDYHTGFGTPDGWTFLYLLSAPLLPPIASRNLLLLQSLPYQHSTSVCQGKEAKRGALCGHGGERTYCAIVSCPLTSSSPWLTVWPRLWCLINMCWRPRPAIATCTSTFRDCCPTYQARMPRTLLHASMSNARSCKHSSGRSPGIIAR